MAIVFTKEKKQYKYVLYGAVVIAVLVGLFLVKGFLVDPLLQVRVASQEFPVQVSEAQLEELVSHPFVDRMNPFPSIEPLDLREAGRRNPFAPIE